MTMQVAHLIKKFNRITDEKKPTATVFLDVGKAFIKDNKRPSLQVIKLSNLNSQSCLMKTIFSYFSLLAAANIFMSSTACLQVTRQHP